MLSIFKRKINIDKLSNIFVNGLFQNVEKSFPDILQVLENVPEVTKEHNIDENDFDRFFMIVLVANFSYLDDSFEGDTTIALKDSITQKTAAVFGITNEKMDWHINQYESFLKRVNHPSKNMIYAMPKAFLHKYRVISCQDDYFKNLNTPNPVLLQRLNEVMESYIWNWDEFFEKYRLV